MRGNEAATERNQINNSNHWWSDLPFDLQDVKITSGSRPVGFRYSPFIFNIEAVLDGVAIVTCGEDSASDIAMTKAMAELTERAAMLEWTARIAGLQRTSSGWAAHESEASCKKSAVLELIERDAVLAQWYSATPFLEIDPDTLPDSIQNWARTELAQSEFPRLHLFISTEGVGPSVSCLFINDNGFGVSGHATKSTLFESIESAIAETCRSAHLAIRKSFWEDSVLLENSTAGRVDPGAHAVYYAYHEAFPRWVFGEVIDWKAVDQIWKQRLFQVNMDSFQFEVALKEPWFVGVASHPQIFEVTWGTSTEDEIKKKMQSRSVSALREFRKLNLKPHIVS